MAASNRVNLADLRRHSNFDNFRVRCADGTRVADIWALPLEPEELAGTQNVSEGKAMKNSILLAISAIALFALVPVSWGQMVPETNPQLAPTKNPNNPTSGESLAAQAQDLTKEIEQARVQGKDTSAATAQQAQGEQAMQKGNEQEALQHFKAGEKALGMDQPESSNAR